MVFGILNCQVFVLEQDLICPRDRGLSRNEWITFFRIVIKYLFLVIDWCYCALKTELTIVIEF